jgi:hypothetical protein
MFLVVPEVLVFLEDPVAQHYLLNLEVLVVRQVLEYLETLEVQQIREVLLHLVCLEGLGVLVY